SPRAFYQLNPQQTQVLYGQAVAALDVSENDHIIDAYCGVGTIGFAFADKVKSVRGMDIIPEAIADAKKNAQRMGFDNTYYEAGRAEDIIPKWYQEGYRADALIVTHRVQAWMRNCFKRFCVTNQPRWFMCLVIQQPWRVIWWL